MQHVEQNNKTISRKTKGTIPTVPFFLIADAILGKEYTLHTSFATISHIVGLNTKYRNESYIPNTLAFPFDKKTGDIYMSLTTIRSQAHGYSLTYHDFLLFLFIHSCLHLKGYDHSSTMEKLEKKYFTQFAPHATYPYDHSDRN